MSSDLGMPGTYRKFPRSEVDCEPSLLQVDLEAATASNRPTIGSRIWKMTKKVVNVLLWIAILILIGYELAGIIGNSHRSESNRNSTVSSASSVQIHPITSSLDWPVTTASVQETTEPSNHRTTRPSTTVQYPTTITSTMSSLPMFTYADPAKPYCPDWFPKDLCEWYASGSTLALPTPSTQYLPEQFRYPPLDWKKNLMPNGPCPRDSGYEYCRWILSRITKAPEMTSNVDVAEQVLGSED